MPVVFCSNGYRFFFFSNEGSPREPLHVHVRRGGDIARFGWSRRLPSLRAMGSRVGNSLISSPWCRSIAPKSKGHGMSISATEVRFDDATMWVSLADGRILGVPLAWFPRLLAAAPADLQRYELSPTGIHWAGLDEDISVAGLLAGRGDQTRPVSMAAE